MDFSEDEIQRYARHILLDEVGGTGQAKLRAARVLIAGAGGLGSPLALYLAAAGIGTIGIADDDRVELSNLQRQIVHTTAGVGTGKAASAARAMAALNPLVRIVQHAERITAANVAGLIAGYDMVCDGTDNLATRFVLADACWAARVTLVSAAILRFEGQLSVFRPGIAADGAALPCYRCLNPAPLAGSDPNDGETCAEAGVLGPVVGVVGSLAAVEVCKAVLGIGESLAGRLLLWDALAMRVRVVRLLADPKCLGCAPDNATTIGHLQQK